MKHRIGVALLAALTVTALAIPAQAATPTYVSSSQPGGLPLYGYHHDQLSPSVHAWAGIQRRSDGWGRLWLKVRGDGRQGSVEYRNLSFYDHGYAAYSACQTTFCVKGPASTIYYVGTWHPVAEEVSVKALSVKWRYTGGASTGQRCVASYRVLVWQKSPIASPTC